MNNNKVLYQIKTLEKIIIRNLVSCELIEEKIVKFHITPTQMQIIEYILEHNNINVYQKDLETVLHLRRATVSGVLQTMEKNGLIKRVQDNNDSRIKKVILNDNTKNLFYKNLAKMENLEQVITKNIEPKELEIFLKVIEKMKENIENYS